MRHREFATCLLELDQIVKARAGGHQLVGQAENFPRTPVAYGDDAGGIDHHQTLVHMFQRGFQQRRLRGEFRFARLDGDDLLADPLLGSLDEPELPPQCPQQKRQTGRRSNCAHGNRDRLPPPTGERRNLGAADIDDDRIDRKWMDRDKNRLAMGESPG